MPVTTNEMRQAIVAEETLQSYTYDIMRILADGCKDEPIYLQGWVTDAAKVSYKAMVASLESQSKRDQATTKKNWLKKLLLDCMHQPVLHVLNCEIEHFMAFLTGIDGEKRMSKSTYNTRCSALHHLFRCHRDYNGYPVEFGRELNLLKKGLFRIVTTNAQDEGGVSDGGGKIPLSKELYEKCCKWFLEKGDEQSIFCHTFLVITWNLMCRAKNTTRILWEHMKFDEGCLNIMFAQQKNDQNGQTATLNPRRVYANPTNPAVCPLFALSLYMATFGGRCGSNDRLFPGKSQYKRFMDGLGAILKEHEVEAKLTLSVKETISDIGSHSIRKGATKWLSGQPGGPSAISICIRGGWSLGGVKDVYMTYNAEGDAFCGRMLSLLPLLSPDFASSAPKIVDFPLPELGQHVNRVYPAMAGNCRMQPLLHRCLAALVHSKDYVMAWPFSHCVRQNNNLFCDQTLLDTLSEKVQVSYPWSDGDDANKSPSGVPPHVVMMVDMKKILNQLGELRSTREDDMRKLLNDVFDDRNVANGSISERRMRDIITKTQEDMISTQTKMLEQFIKKFEKQPGVDSTSANDEGPTIYQAAQQGNSLFPFYDHSDSCWPVPEDYEFPSGTVQDLWTRWNVGDTVNGIPALKTLQGKDFTFMASRPLQEGQNKARSPGRTFCDIKALCKYIEIESEHHAATEENGLVLDCSTPEKACAVLYSVATQENGIINNASNRSKHCKWSTALTRIQLLKRKRSNREGGADSVLRRANAQRPESPGGQSNIQGSKSTDHGGGTTRGTSAGSRGRRRQSRVVTANGRHTSETPRSSRHRARSNGGESRNNDGGLRTNTAPRRSKRRRQNNDLNDGDAFARAFSNIAVPEAAREREKEHDAANAAVVLTGAREDAEARAHARIREIIQPIADGTYLHHGNT